MQAHFGRANALFVSLYPNATALDSFRLTGLPTVTYMSTVETFEHIIRHRSSQELVPFLMTLPKTETVAVRQKAKALEEELTASREKEQYSWGNDITPDQTFMFLLVRMKTFNRTEGMRPGFQVWAFWLTAEQKALYWTVVEQARPDWLMDKLVWLAASKDWATPDYRMLREMENRQLIGFDPGLFAAALPMRLFDFSMELSSSHSVPANAADVIINTMQSDRVLLERDVPLLFDFDTGVDSTRADVQLKQPNQEWGVESWKAWNSAHPPQYVSWMDILVSLTTTGHLTRADMLTRCLVALRRDFRRSLLTWFKSLSLALKPTLAEQLERQQELVELLAHPLPLVVNFALDQLKPLWVEARFDSSPALVYAEGLVVRQDLKTGLRSLLDGMEKLLKRAASLAPELGRLSAAALSSADGGVQERAAKVLVAILTANPAPATEAEMEDMIATAGLYVDLLAPSARLLLQPWLSEPQPFSAFGEEEAPDTYAVPPDFVPDLSSSSAIVPVQDWHELLFLTGQVLRHNDPGARERWLEGLLRLKPHFPEEYEAQWEPYVAQLLPVMKQHSPAENAALLAGPISVHGYDGLAQALLLSGATGFAVRRVETVAQKTEYLTSDPLMGADQQRLAFAEDQLRQPIPLPLLSTPTHQPFWIAPTALVARLRVYEAAGQAPNAADVAIALARTAHLNQANAQAAQAEASLLENEVIRDLVVWFLDPVSHPLPNAKGGTKTVLTYVSERLRQLLPSAGATTAPGLSDVMPYLWAVAARTKYPDGVFEALTGLVAGDYPGVVRPWQPEWSVEAKTGAQGFAHTWTELSLAVETPDAPVPSNLLLYSQHVGMKRAGRYQQWPHNMPLSVDYPYLASLLPNNASPLHWHVLNSAAWVDKLEAADRDIIHHALRSLLGPGPVFDQAASLVLATGLVHHAAVCRAVAVEVLLSAVKERRLVPGVLGHALGQLLAAGYAPVPRLADSLVQVRAIDSVTDDALRQVLEALLPEFPELPPRNAGKLLEAYAFLISRNPQPIPVAVKNRLLVWGRLPAMKKIVSTIGV